MVNSLSVCLPAYNEERCIGHTLDSVLCQDFPGKMEVLVDVNGSRDGTEKIVGEFAERDLRVTLIVDPVMGKPRAWNTLIKKARNDIVIFIDGDEYHDPRSFNLIHQRLMETGKIGVSGNVIFCYNSAEGAIQKWQHVKRDDLNSSTFPFSGGLYGIHKNRLLDRMKELGLDGMPEEIINEDYFLSVVIGARNRDFEDRALAYHAVPGLVDEVRAKLRNSRGRRQIYERFPQLREEMARRNSGEKTFRLNKGLHTLYTIAQSNPKEALQRSYSLATAILSAGIISLMTRYGRIRTLSSEWTTSRTTKKPIYAN